MQLTDYPNYFKIHHPDSRVLIISLRGIHNEAYRSPEYEFEDLICSFDRADLITFDFQENFQNSITKKISNTIAQLLHRGSILESGCSPLVIDKKYDLIFFICQHYWDITCLNSIKKWRKHSHTAVAWIDELWSKEIRQSKVKICLELLKQFDYVFTTQSNSIKPIAEITKCRCFSLPYAVDAIDFCPYPNELIRNIDIYSIGRRSPTVHKSLLKFSRKQNYLYLYDTLKGLEMSHYREHRRLYSNLIKRSRYFIANKAKFDAFHQTGGQEELGSRFFEGAAGGAVMIGIPPTSESYKKYFDWEDAVIPISYDADYVVDIIAELDKQPYRLEKIRKDNIYNSLLRHDWVYRWSNILDIVGMERTTQMLGRESKLQQMAENVMVQSISGEVESLSC
ncbi:MAG: glycosyltransferase [Mastigocoleus sp.]